MNWQPAAGSRQFKTGCRANESVLRPGHPATLPAS